jgi:hypothetical protein
MRRLAAIAFAALVLAGAAEAQPKWTSYPLVAVAIPKEPNDPSLTVFRARLLEIARKKDADALIKLVAKDFFWERDFGGSYEKKKSPFINFATALNLAAADDSGWRLLAAFAEQQPGPHEKKRGTFCGPPQAKYNDKAFEKLLKDTNSDVFDWSYPAHAHVIVREKGEAGSPEIAKLSAHFVFTDLSARSEKFDFTKDWTQVILPDGKRGFVAPGELYTPLDPRLCFVKRTGVWTIAGYIGGGD